MPTPWHVETETYRIRKFCVGPLENNVYVVACAVTGSAVIIDAADEADRILGEVADVTPLAILTTHGHWDHVQAAIAVRDQLTVPFRIGEADQQMAGIDADTPFEPDEPIAVGDLVITAVHTPGHTAGSTSFVLEGHVFTGDTLFPGGPGATRGGGASFSQIIDSVRDRLFTLPGETLVHPGHGLDTTIATESPALADWVARGY